MDEHDANARATDAQMLRTNAFDPAMCEKLTLNWRCAPVKLISRYAAVCPAEQGLAKPLWRRCEDEMIMFSVARFHCRNIAAVGTDGAENGMQIASRFFFFYFILCAKNNEVLAG